MRSTASSASRATPPARQVAPEALQRLTALEWPGNVRELRNSLERLVILAGSPTIGVADVERLVGRRIAEAGDQADLMACTTYEEFREASERAFLRAKLRAFDWNVSETARAIDMPRSNLYKKIERHHLTRDDQT